MAQHPDPACQVLFCRLISIYAGRSMDQNLLTTWSCRFTYSHFRIMLVFVHNICVWGRSHWQVVDIADHVPKKCCQLARCVDSSCARELDLVIDTLTCARIVIGIWYWKSLTHPQFEDNCKHWFCSEGGGIQISVLCSDSVCLYCCLSLQLKIILTGRPNINLHDHEILRIAYRYNVVINLLTMYNITGNQSPIASLIIPAS